ncbi:MAG TPA: Ig-like domain-containing protein, partial [Micromonosporaceae bacterium]|nr:Ig-like domain-containing protein [Micromonosporaceae bacterium]
SGAASVGVLEWKLHAEPATAVQPVTVTTPVGQIPALPGTVTKVYADGTTAPAPVVWEPVTPDQVAAPGTFTRVGIVDGTPLRATATVTVLP